MEAKASNMSDLHRTNAEVIAQIRNDLKECAGLLREGERLNADSRNTLAKLLEELGTELDPSARPSEQTVQLAQLVGKLARSIHEQHHANLLASSRKRLAEAAHWAESHSPVATDIVSRFLELLASIGI